MPHFVKHSNQLQDGIQPVRLFSVRALIHIHRTRSIIHWQFFLVQLRLQFANEPAVCIYCECFEGQKQLGKNEPRKPQKPHRI